MRDRARVSAAKTFIVNAFLSTRLKYAFMALRLTEWHQCGDRDNYTVKKLISFVSRLNFKDMKKDPLNVKVRKIRSEFGFANFLSMFTDDCDLNS